LTTTGSGFRRCTVGRRGCAQRAGERLRAQLLDYDIVQMDETRIRVLKEEARPASAAAPSFMWVQLGGAPAQPMILFHYDPSRGQAVAAELVDAYRGYLQTDGFEG
jgi:transposase